MKPPRVYEVIIPSSHITMRITKIVQSISSSCSNRGCAAPIELVGLGLQATCPGAHGPSDVASELHISE
jgi:hypothetical protein